MQVGFLRPLPCQLCHSGHRLAFLFARLYLLEHHLCHVGIAVEEVVHFCLYEVAHIFVHGHSVGAHGLRTELYLGLALKHRLLHIDGDGSYESVADVGIFKVLVEELLYRLCQMLLECALVCTALCGMLSVYE